MPGLRQNLHQGQQLAGAPEEAHGGSPVHVQGLWQQVQGLVSAQAAREDVQRDVRLQVRCLREGELQM